MLIVERAVPDEDLTALLDAALGELVAKYGPEGRSAVRDEARYLVALDERVAVGCGAVQPAGGTTGELKRMYVVPGHRGRGIARSLLKTLEGLAAEMGYDRLRLATGARQPEAVALYESAGYARTAPYGKYVGEPLTFCYAKPLL